jgi:hypothetical protein
MDSDEFEKQNNSMDVIDQNPQNFLPTNFFI